MKSVDRRIFCVPALLGWLLLWAPVAAEEPGVTITGGLRPDGSFYEWEIVNNSSLPVVSLEFPHYAADLFTPPKGWRSKSKFRELAGNEKDPWTCRAWVESPKDGIPPRGKVSVTMRVLMLESRPGRGVVKVGLADGKTLEIANVEIPSPPGYFERFGVLITLAILIGIVALIAARRQRRAKGRAGATASEESPRGHSPSEERP